MLVGANLSEVKTHRVLALTHRLACLWPDQESAAKMLVELIHASKAGYDKITLVADGNGVTK